MNVTSKIEINDEWQEWIKLNINRGCDKNGIFKILIDNGFSYQSIQHVMNFKPDFSLDQIENPLIKKNHENINDEVKQLINLKLLADHFFLPSAIQENTRLAEIFTVDNFLNQSECNYLIQQIQKETRPSTICNQESEPDKDYRTSKTCDLGLLNDATVKEIDNRICRYMGIEPSYSEEIQGQLYDIGEQFKEHTDYFDSDNESMQSYLKNKGQRTWTVMIYLNNNIKGGETRFIKLNKTFKPKLGMAIIWNNLTPTGQPNIHTLHEGMPVIKGNKAIITKWFRTNGINAIATKNKNELIKNYTRTGFKKTKVPILLFKQILNFYRANHHNFKHEVVPAFIQSSNNNQAASEILDLPHSLKERIHNTMLPICENWAGIKLIPTYVFGIRRYNKMAALKLHRDKIETHIISAIINVDQDTNEDWLLTIEDNYYRRHKINMAPRNALLYEGSRLLHGRPEPLNGEYYCNIFVHYQPLDLKN